MDKKTELKSIPITEIHDDKRLRRDYGNKEEWEEFKKDIEQHGLYSAISVTPIERDVFSYRLLAGGRRLRACAELGYEEINATIFTGKIDKHDMMIIELNENLKRKNLNMEEEAKGKLLLLETMQSKYGLKKNKRDKKGISQLDIANMIGESAVNFRRDINLAQAIKAVPSLTKAKNKNEAMKILKKGLKGYKEEKRVTEIKEQTRKAKGKKDPKDIIAGWYRIGDVLDEMPKANANTCSLIEIDPPYAIDLGKNKKGNQAINSMDQYNEIESDDYPNLMKSVLVEAFRMAKDDAWLILWFDPVKWWNEIFLWATQAGWIGRPLPAIWNKGLGQTQQPTIHLASSYEMFFYFRKTQASKMNKAGRGNVFNYKPVSVGNKSHPTERPIELMQELIETFVGKGHIICSPFAGSGNTLLAQANQTGIGYGWDLSKSYQNSYVLKAHNGVPGKYRSYK
ncbi:MAG: ParB N-terminal domain-containing protein [Alphaproteobacteria bacterium]|nr:ParB N-terminal domain-containing protein [Alphaproteobacteria bacterium]